MRSESCESLGRIPLNESRSAYSMKKGETRSFDHQRSGNEGLKGSELGLIGFPIPKSTTI